MQNYDPHDLRGQEQSKREEEALRKLQRQNDEADFRWLMQDVRGRRFVWRLLEKTGVYRSSFTGNSETFFREGQRNIGLMLVADIHAICPEQYTAMVQEQQKA